MHANTGTISAQYPPTGYGTGCISVGKHVDSHFLHFHPATTGGSEVDGYDAEGCVSFDADIFGIETSSGYLNESETRSDPIWSDGYGPLYPHDAPSDVNRGLEPPDSPGPQDDVITDYVSAVCMHGHWYGVHDEIRVVTAGIGSVALSSVPGHNYTGSHPVDSEVCVGATVRRESFAGRGGQLAPNERVQMNVTGANTTGVADDDQNSDAYSSLCYTGTNAGSDSIAIFADHRSEDGVFDVANGTWNQPDEAGDSATTTWTKRPTSTTGELPRHPVAGSSTTSARSQ